MGESSVSSNLLASVRSKAKALGLTRRENPENPVLPTHREPTASTASTTDHHHHHHNNNNDSSSISEKPPNSNNGDSSGPATRLNSDRSTPTTALDKSAMSAPPPDPPPVQSQAAGADPSAIGPDPKPRLPTRMKNGTRRFISHSKDALLYSWVNVLLVFVPIGIASRAAGLAPDIVFAMNAIAIIPLAGLLSHATEAVAARLGDTMGALLNVSFGNAVELILFIILLAGNQIRVVQAALLGSILANLLLILGMAFLLGGLRFQEQIYNSTVTQMSACMLSLAVMSLLLPTAFHAAFANNEIADRQTLHVSRGTSVVLLLVYVLYLVFQLKSHAYMYASTPQHIIDEESHPGVLTNMLNSSSSSDTSSSSSSSDTDSSEGSHTTAKRIRRAFRMRRKSSASSKEASSVPSALNSPSIELQGLHTDSHSHATEADGAVRSGPTSLLDAIMSGDEADIENPGSLPQSRDFGAGPSSIRNGKNGKREKRKSKKHRKHRHHGKPGSGNGDAEASPIQPQDGTETGPKVAFADQVQQVQVPVAKRPFALRPALPSLLSNNVFSNAVNPAPTTGSPALNPRIAGPHTLRRTTSLPDRMNRPGIPQAYSNSRPSPSPHPASIAPSQAQETEEEHNLMSRTSAVVMLIISTALVAVCADFMSDSIEPMVKKTGIHEAFIGLIILPIVGNAAEHVTAVTVAAKNKMDLAIGVAVGSSIQIAIFVTPFIVVLGWIMGKDMSLYFNIFETVALFVTAFVVNFLVLDGRSNYLEGSLLIAAYVIIGVASFFYPDSCQASPIGGHEGACAS